MPKMKASGSAKKRFEITGSGKIKRKRAYHSHILTKKSPKRKRLLRTTTLISAVDEPRVKRLLAL
ncbi:MAG: 50S ribosomal protein L35 [Ignavibacteria bacterium]|nr:50S ribosomal protein L35 [Ignavibacteria bacterium]